MKRALRVIFAVGGLLTILGLIMIPLPGPGNLFVSLGLQVLATGLFLSAVGWLSRRWNDPANL
jgi:Putative transmembrane protein (PGPGW)